jgi:hypothetical protein
MEGVMDQAMMEALKAREGGRAALWEAAQAFGVKEVNLRNALKSGALAGVLHAPEGTRRPMWFTTVSAVEDYLSGRSSNARGVGKRHTVYIPHANLAKVEEVLAEFGAMIVQPQPRASKGSVETNGEV